MHFGAHRTDFCIDISVLYCQVSWQADVAAARHWACSKLKTHYFSHKLVMTELQLKSKWKSYDRCTETTYLSAFFMFSALYWSINHLTIERTKNIVHDHQSKHWTINIELIILIDTYLCRYIYIHVWLKLHVTTYRAELTVEPHYRWLCQ